MGPQTPMKNAPTVSSGDGSLRRGKKRKLNLDVSGLSEEGAPDESVKDTDLCTFVCELLEAADKYEMNRLRLMCEHYLVMKLNVDNVHQILRVADKHDAAKLKLICFDIFAREANELVGTAAFKSLNPTLMNELLAAVLTRQAPSKTGKCL